MNALIMISRSFLREVFITFTHLSTLFCLMTLISAFDLFSLSTTLTVEARNFVVPLL